MKTKLAGILLMIAALIFQTAAAEESLSAVRKDGILMIEWTAEGPCVLTVMRDGWPVTVCNVNGEDGGTTMDASGGEEWSVRLETPKSCIVINAASGDGAPEQSDRETPVPTERETPAPPMTETPGGADRTAAPETEEPSGTDAPAPTDRETPLPSMIPAPERTLIPPENTPSDDASSSGDVQILNARAEAVVREVNAERAARGLGELTVSPELTAAARVRAVEIVGSFSHTRPDGSHWSTVSEAALGENIARGHASADRVMAAWMTSEGHRQNILREGFGSIGVCAVEADGVVYWVQLFGK